MTKTIFRLGNYRSLPYLEDTSVYKALKMAQKALKVEDDQVLNILAKNYIEAHNNFEKILIDYYIIDSD